MTSTQPRRRWLQFNLRTLFVIMTAFAIWLGWETKCIRERQRVYEELRNNGWNEHLPPLAEVTNTAGIPLWRRMLGDRSFGGFRLYNDGDIDEVTEEESRVARLFPEATYYKFGTNLGEDSVRHTMIRVVPSRH